MADFQPLARQSLADGVFDQIVDQIVAGDLPDGGALPSERDLAEAFGVSRPAVREALKRLGEIGMVEIRQGESTTVRPWRRTVGPDLLARLLTRTDGSVDLRVARSILEVRQAVAPDIAALAASRAASDEAVHLALASTIDRLAADEDDPVEMQWNAIAYWDVLVDASQNVAYRLMTNALIAAYVPLIDALAEVMRPEVSNLEAYRRLARSIRAGDPADARVAADHLLSLGTTAVIEAIEALLVAEDALTAAEGEQ